MAQTIGAGVVLLLAVYGCAEGVRRLVLRLMRPPKGHRCLWLLPLTGAGEEAEYLARSASALRRWQPLSDGEVYIVDGGVDAKAADRARRVCETVPGVQFVGQEEFTAVFADFLPKNQK